MRPQLGSLIGAHGGLVFVLVNAGSLPGPGGWALRVLAVIVFVAGIFRAMAWTLIAIALVGRTDHGPGRPGRVSLDRGAGRLRPAGPGAGEVGPAEPPSLRFGCSSAGQVTMGPCDS